MREYLQLFLAAGSFRATSAHLCCGEAQSLWTCWEGNSGVVRGQKASLRCRVILVLVFFLVVVSRSCFQWLPLNVRFPKSVPPQVQSRCALATLLSLSALHASAPKKRSCLWGSSAIFHHKSILGLSEDYFFEAPNLYVCETRLLSLTPPPPFWSISPLFQFNVPSLVASACKSYVVVSSPPSFQPNASSNSFCLILFTAGLPVPFSHLHNCPVNYIYLIFSCKNFQEENVSV